MWKGRLAVARTRFASLLLVTSCLLATTLLCAEARKVVKKGPPQYPPLALKMKVAGTVVLEVEVEADGNVGEVKVVSGHALLRPAAVDCVKKWKYEAGSGKTLEVVGIDFKLPG